MSNENQDSFVTIPTPDITDLSGVLQMPVGFTSGETGAAVQPFEHAPDLLVRKDDSSPNAAIDSPVQLPDDVMPDSFPINGKYDEQPAEVERERGAMGDASIPLTERGERPEVVILDEAAFVKSPAQGWPIDAAAMTSKDAFVSTEAQPVDLEKDAEDVQALIKSSPELEAWAKAAMASGQMKPSDITTGMVKRVQAGREAAARVRRCALHSIFGDDVLRMTNLNGTLNLTFRGISVTALREDVDRVRTMVQHFGEGQKIKVWMSANFPSVHKGLLKLDEFLTENPDTTYAYISDNLLREAIMALPRLPYMSPVGAKSPFAARRKGAMYHNAKPA